MMPCSIIPIESPDGVKDDLVFAGFSVLVLFLVLICALLAVLTLAICGLDITWLQVLSSTGDQKQRNRALVIFWIKRHGSWFLCKLGTLQTML
jgi:hypothetical protein